jgi:hypothetical protein
VNQIYKLKLHESMSLNSRIDVLRVPGGWVYKTMQGSVFVPWDNEYQKTDESNTSTETKGE